MLNETQILDGLNEAQESAVRHTDGPLLIVAGAGTGKTTVLTRRLAYLTQVKNIATDNILLVTFTDKAAGELEERADQLLPYGYFGLWIDTFHGLAEKILRRHGLDIGLPADFKLLSTTEQWILIKKNLDHFRLDYYRPLGNPHKFIQELVKHFSRLKDEDITDAQYADYCLEQRQDQDQMLSGAKIKSKSEDKIDLDRLAELAGAYQTYNQLLLDHNYLDFGDLLRYTLQLLRQRPDILKIYQQQFQYVMVDEFQDTNWAQYELIKLLALPHNNLLVVGDDDQSVYKFRGASLANIMTFQDDFPEARRLVLTENYRSGQFILDKAYQLIQNNNPFRLETKLNLDKRLLAKRELQGTAEFLQFATDHQETAGVAALVSQLKNKPDTNWSDIAILARANDTADKFVKELSRQGIPNQFVSRKGLYYKTIIVDLLAYLRLLDDFHDSASLFRVLNLPLFKIDQADLVELGKFARAKLLSLFAAAKLAANIPNLSDSGRDSLIKLLQYVTDHSQAAQTTAVSKLFLLVARDCFVLDLDTDRDALQFNYLDQFYRKITALEISQPDARLRDLLEQLDLELEAGEAGSLRAGETEDADTVKVMTVHGSKGLEFRFVIIAGAVDKKFPTNRHGEIIPLPDGLVREGVIDRDAHLEEERRLFYVAMTRARDGLFITGAKDYGGVTAKKPSRFVSEAGLTVTEVTGLTDDLEVIQEIKRLDQNPLITTAPYWPAKFSFSQLAAYQNCPWLYKLIYILHIPMADKQALVFGRVIHNCLREFLQPFVTGLQTNLFGEAVADVSLLSKERLLKLYRDFWVISPVYRDQAEAEAFQQAGRQMLTALADSLTAAPTIFCLEKQFNLKIGGWQIVGSIDRVDRLPDGTMAIIDYKTGNPKDKLTYDDKRQLLLYYLALTELWQLPVSRLTYYYLQSGESVSFVAQAKDLEKLKAEIIATIDDIHSGRFEHLPGEKCRYGDHRNVCGVMLSD